MTLTLFEGLNARNVKLTVVFYLLSSDPMDLKLCMVVKCMAKPLHRMLLMTLACIKKNIWCVALTSEDINPHDSLSSLQPVLTKIWTFAISHRLFISLKLCMIITSMERACERKRVYFLSDLIFQGMRADIEHDSAPGDDEEESSCVEVSSRFGLHCLHCYRQGKSRRQFFLISCHSRTEIVSFTHYTHLLHVLLNDFIFQGHVLYNQDNSYLNVKIEVTY